MTFPEVVHNPWLNKGVHISLEGYIHQCHTQQVSDCAEGHYAGFD